MCKRRIRNQLTYLRAFIQKRLDSLFLFVMSFVMYCIGCGGFFERGLHSGTMFSPSYPDDYPPNLSCTWSILVDDESQIALSFNEFELENTAECFSDYVIVQDGFLRSSEILGKYCGTDVPVYLLSSGNKMSVTLHTDSVRNAKGFEISWMKYSPLPSGPIARTQPPGKVLIFANPVFVWLFSTIHAWSNVPYEKLLLKYKSSRFLYVKIQDPQKQF